MYPSILNIETLHQSVTLILRFDENYLFFNGHFPTRKVLPAVIQIELCMRALQDHLHSTLKFAGINFAKFLKPIQPLQEVKLRLKLDEQKLCLEFCYEIIKADRLVKASEGKLTLCH